MSRVSMSRMLALLIIALLMPSFASAENKSFSITLENLTPAFDASVFVEVVMSGPRPFEKKNQNTFSYSFSLPEHAWSDTLEIKIIWRDAYLKNDRTKADFFQRIVLRIRRDALAQ